MASASDLYLSADVESDGPVPGKFSMLSFGLAVAGSFDGRRFSRAEPGKEARYWELRPISSEFDAAALAVNGLDRARLERVGLEPSQAMREASAWIRSVAGARRAVLVAYPLAFDWSFLHWYFTVFADESPFGHGTSIDVRSFYMGAAGVPYTEASKRRLPPSLLPTSPHTHNALDDAVEQGELFANIFEWMLSRRSSTTAA